MTKIIIPAKKAEVDGALFTLVYNGAVLKTDVKNTLENGKRIIDDSNASPDQKLVIDEAQILEILAEGGEIENYLFGIKAPLSSSNIDVPEGIPLRLNIVDEVRNFKNWFSNNAGVWKNTTTGELIYYNNPNPSGGPILKASEAEIIRQLDTNTYSFLTVAEVQEEVEDPDWVKL